MNARFREDSRIEQLRVPPQSIEAEQAVLGGLMLSADPKSSGRVWDDVADLLDDASFYRREHQLIWKAIAHLHSKQKPFDAVTIGEWLQGQGLSEQIEIGYLVELASTTPSAANARAYAEIVAEKARLRRVIEVGTDLVNCGFTPNGSNSIEIIGKAQTKIGNLLASEPCDLESLTPIMMRVFDRIQDRYAGGESIPGLSTGYGEIDALIGGMGAGQLLLLAARPSMGKTTMAQNIAEHISLERQKEVAVFSFEMQPDELGDRMLASIGDIDSDRIRNGQLDDADWANVTSAIRKLRGAKIMVSKPRSARVEQVVAQARRQHARSPLGLIIVDYLQLMQTSGDNRAQGIGDITRALKLMAGEIGVPVLLLSQLNRDLEKRPDKRPMMSDLRDSGAIEQDADVILFIYRDEYYNRESRDRGTAEIIVAKQRNGRTDTVRLKYRPERFRFENLPFGWEPEPLPAKASKPRAGFKKGGNAAADRAAGDA